MKINYSKINSRRWRLANLAMIIGFLLVFLIMALPGTNLPCFGFHDGIDWIKNFWCS